MDFHNKPSLNQQTGSGLSIRLNDVLKSLSRRDLYPLVLLFIPVLVLTGDRSIVYSLPGYLDPWFYFALFQHPATWTRMFPNTYYGSRLSFIFPGSVIYHILPPVTANYVFHLLVWFCAAIALYVALKCVTDRRTALLSAVVLGFYPYLWKATGWDYPDGAGIAYYLVTIACLTTAGKMRKPSWALILVAGGSCAAAFYTNMVWVMFIPFLPVLWIWLRRLLQLPLDLPRAALSAAIGALFCTVILAIASRSIGGAYLFYSPSIRFALKSLNAPNPWKARGIAWVPSAYWLFLPAMAVVSALATIVRAGLRSTPRRNRLSLIFCGNLLFCAGIFVFFENRNMGLLECYYYASCLIPSVFLFLGARAWVVPENMNKLVFWSILVLTMVALFLTWREHGGQLWVWLTRFGNVLPLSVVLLVIVASAISRPRTSLLVSALCAAAVIDVGARSAGLIFVDDPVPVENAFHRIVESGNYCEQYRQGRRIRFWYGPDPNSPEFQSINSLYFYGYSQLGLDFPTLPAALPDLADTVVVVLSTKADAGETAQRSLAAAGLKVRLVGNRRVSWNNTEYTLAFLEFDRVTSGLVNGDFETGTRPWAGGWAKLRTENGGQSGKCLVLEAEEGASQFAMEWNVLKLNSGSHYKLRVWVKSGSSGDEPFQVGLWDDKQDRWVAYQTGRSTGTWTAYTVSIASPPTDMLSVELMKNSGTKGSMLFDTVTLSAE